MDGFVNVCNFISCRYIIFRSLFFLAVNSITRRITTKNCDFGCQVKKGLNFFWLNFRFINKSDARKIWYISRKASPKTGITNVSCFKVKVRGEQQQTSTIYLFCSFFSLLLPCHPRVWLFVYLPSSTSTKVRSRRASFSFLPSHANLPVRRRRPLEEATRRQSLFCTWKGNHYTLNCRRAKKNRRKKSEFKISWSFSTTRRLAIFISAILIYFYSVDIALEFSKIPPARSTDAHFEINWTTMRNRFLLTEQISIHIEWDCHNDDLCQFLSRYDFKGHWSEFKISTHPHWISDAIRNHSTRYLDLTKCQFFGKLQ